MTREEHYKNVVRKIKEAFKNGSEFAYSYKTSNYDKRDYETRGYETRGYETNIKGIVCSYTEDLYHTHFIIGGVIYKIEYDISQFRISVDNNFVHSL